MSERVVDRRISLNSLSTASWSLAQDLDLCRRLGVSSIALYLSKLDADPDGVARIGDADVHVSQVFTRGMTLYDETCWPAERDYLLAGVETAAALDAPWLGLTAGAAGAMEWDDAVDALVRALEPVARAARARGIGVAIEHTLPTRVEVGFIQSLADCVEVAQQLGLGATMELNYCFRERRLDETIAAAVAADVLAVVQVCDLVPPSTTVPDRAAIGDGVIPVRRIVNALLDHGYRGPFEIEILGPRVEEDGYEPVLTRSVEALDAILMNDRLRRRT